MPVHRMIESRGWRAAVWTAVSGGLLLVIAVIALVLWLQGDNTFSQQGFEDAIRSWGMWGVIVAIGLMIVHSFVPFPAELVAFANGMVYGPFWGTVITWVGAMAGALVAFGLARRLGRPFVERMLARRHWQSLDEWAAHDGWQVVLVSRFIPVIAFNLINYAAGLTRLTWWQFTWTTGVGILPLTCLMVTMGDNVESLSWESWLLLLVGGMLLWLTLHRRLKVRPGRGREASHPK